MTNQQRFVVVKSTHRNTLAVGCGSPVKARGMSRNTARYAAFSILATSFGGLDGMAKAMPVTLRVPPVFHTHSSCRPMWKWNGSCSQAQLELSMAISLAPIGAPVIVSQAFEAVRSCAKCGSTEQHKDGRCQPCDSERKRAWYAANKDKQSKVSKAWRAANPETVRALKRAYRAANPEKVSAATKAWRAANPENGKEQKKAYRAANKDKIKAVTKVWLAANVEKRRATTEARRKANPEKAKTESSAWAIANPEKAKEAAAAWRKANPESVRVTRENRRARKHASGGTLSKGLPGKLFKLQKGTCPCCGLPLGDDRQLDHVIPLALGGANEDWNMQLLRKICNLQKSMKHPVDFMQSRGFLL